MKTFYYPTEDEPQVELEVVGSSDDFFIRRARSYIEVLEEWVDCTDDIRKSNRIATFVEEQLIVQEFEREQKEDYYWDLAKDMMVMGGN